MADDAVVIGAGPNGLAAAIALAREGLRVTVFEAGPCVGGGARTEASTIDGFRHDVCSAVHPLAVGSPFLRELPLDRHGLHWVHPDLPLVHPLDGGRAAVLRPSVDDTARGLGDDAASYRAWVEPFAQRWEEAAQEVLDSPLHWPRHPLLLSRFGLRALRSARSQARRFRTVGARALLAGLAAHSVLPLGQAASSAIALVLAAAAHAVGWPSPRGGAGRITEAMAAQLVSVGGRIEVNTPILADGDLPRTRFALYDVAPRALAELAPHLPETYRNRLQRYRHGPGAFKVDWALDGPIPWEAAECRRAGTVHVGGTFEEIDAAMQAPWNGKAAERPFVLLGQPSVFDPTRAPAGGQAVWAYCHVPPGSDADMTEPIEAQVERFAPGFRRRIVARATRTARALAADNPNCVGGDVTGGVPDVRQIFARPTLAWKPWATPDPRIFLCSAATPPGGGVHGMCGFHAARTALARR